MNKKLFISLAPLLATVAVVMPGAAQAAPPPQWFENCGGSSSGTCEVPEGMKLPTVSWGALEARSSSAPPITCHVELLGDIENPAGDIAGIAQTEVFTTYDCESPGTPCAGGGLEFAVLGEHLPWPGKLFDGYGLNGVGSGIRLESKEIEYTFYCTKAGTGPYPAKEQRNPTAGDIDDPEVAAPPKITCGAPGTGISTPLYVNGSSIGDPSRIVFDSMSGSLPCTVIGPITIADTLQTMEFNSQATLEVSNAT